MISLISRGGTFHAIQRITVNVSLLMPLFNEEAALVQFLLVTNHYLVLQKKSSGTGHLIMARNSLLFLVVYTQSLPHLKLLVN